MTAPAAAPELDLEHVACALCGADDARPIIQGRDIRRHMPGEFTVVQCRRCGLAYVNPRPTIAAIRVYYPPDYAHHQLTPPSMAERTYYRLLRSLPATDGARVLDVGCGGGKYLQCLRAQGYRVAGTEVNADLAQRLRDRFGFEVFAGEIADAGIPSASFDVVTLWWVLEHTHNPLRTLREAHRVLKPGGMIAVGLQNFASLGRLLFGASWHHLDLPGHLYQFEPQTLRAMLRRAGFETVRLRQDLFAKDLAPSLGYRLRLRRSLDWALPNLLALPFELLAWSLRRSGLITAYAVQS